MTSCFPQNLPPSPVLVRLAGSGPARPVGVASRPPALGPGQRARVALLADALVRVPHRGTEHRALLSRPELRQSGGKLVRRHFRVLRARDPEPGHHVLRARSGGSSASSAWRARRTSMQRAPRGRTSSCWRPTSLPSTSGACARATTKAWSACTGRRGIRCSSTCSSAGPGPARCSWTGLRTSSR